jgi:hypothetical protein
LPRYYHTATLLQSGKVLIAGGDSTSNYAAISELFDPASGSFSNTGPLLEPGIEQNATLLPNGTVLISGLGRTMEFYDPTAGVFTGQGVFMTVSRRGHTATRLADGRILLVGGYDANGNMNSSAEIYDPSTRKIALTGSLAAARHGHSATLSGNGKVLVVGGFSDITDIALVPTAELYDPISGTFSPTSSPNVARGYHTATLLPNGKVFIAGGEIPNITPNLGTASVELYDPSTGTFSPAGSMTTPRFWHTATLLNDGRVLIAEGNAGPVVFPPPTFSAPDELYDPNAGSFTPIGTPELTNTSHAGPFDSALMASGQVLVDVGTIFDPTSNTLSAVDFRSIEYSGIGNYEFSLLPNSQVFLVGGAVSERSTNAYLFDPPSKTYVVAGNTEYSRSSPTAMLLSNGEVLIAGGASEKEVEFYLPPSAASAPSIAAVSPSPIAGFNPVPITVRGANFVTGAAISIDGQLLPTTLVSGSQLTATVSQATLLVPGSHTITVTNFDGETSGPFAVTVSNPLLQSGLPNGSTVSFGSSPVTIPSLQVLGFNNMGNAPFTFDLISITGTNSADFVFDATNTTCPLQGGTLQPSNGCVLHINFIPRAAGVRDATLTVTYEIPGSPIVLTLSGTGISDPAMSIAPASLAFGNQVMGTTSASQVLNISSTGTDNLTISSVQHNSTDFSVTNNCLTPLAPGSACTIAISYTPSSAGGLGDSLVVVGNDPGSPHTIQLTGTGTNFTIAPVTGTTGSATVAAGQPAAYQLSLSPQAFSGAVTLSCVETKAIPNTTCTASPNPAMLNGTTATPVTVTVTTMARSGLSAPAQMRRFPHPNAYEARAIRLLSDLLALLVLALASRTGRKGTRLALTTAFLLMLLVTGCAGSGGNSGTPTSGSTGTPAGTYQLLVTAASSGATRTLTLSLTVQ